MKGPTYFEFEEDDSYIVKVFKKSKTYMWFREPIDNPKAVFNNLPLH